MRRLTNSAQTRKNEGPSALVFSFALKIPLAILLAAPLVIATTGCFSQKSAVLNKPIMTINSTEISTQEFSERLAQKLKHFDALHVKDETVLERAKADTAQTFVLEVITKDYAKKNNITVSSAEIDAKVNEVRSKYPDQVAFRRALAEENLSVDKWRQDMELTVLQRKVFDKVTSTAPQPTEAEMREYYDQNKASFQTPARVRLRQIVLAKEDDAKRIVEELNDGGDMAKLAKSFSVAPEGENGGDTGWLEKGTLEIFDQAFKMNVGARSKILKSPYGYHIYEVLKKEPEARLSFQDAEAKIRSQLMERKKQAAFTAWLEEQVRKTSVKRNEALIRAIKVTTRGS